MKGQAFVILLAGCAGEDPPVTTQEGAPFVLRGTHALWAGAKYDTTVHGLLVITDRDLSCEELAVGPTVWDPIPPEGRGILFIFTIEDTLGKVLGSAAPYAYQDGVAQRVWTATSDSPLTLNTYEDDLQGAFFISYWYGTFDAEPCGELTILDGADTGS